MTQLEIVDNASFLDAIGDQLKAVAATGRALEDTRRAELQHAENVEQLRQQVGGLAVHEKWINFADGVATRRAERAPRTGAICGWIEDRRPLKGRAGKVLDALVVDDTPMLKVSLRRGKKIGQRFADLMLGSEIYLVKPTEATFTLSDTWR